MENTTQLFEDIVAQRLVAKAEREFTKLPTKPEQVGEPLSGPTQPPQPPETLPDFVKIEKNLASFGFFTPSSKRSKNTKAKTVSFTKVLDGKRVEAKATIAPAAIYGLPITADQDKYLALQKLIAEIRQRNGQISNPITFTSAELLQLLQKHRRSGKNYKDVEEWLRVMTATTIVSEGAVYFAGKKAWATDVFHVFDRAVVFGSEIEPGKIADRNYVWLSSWQLENINSNHQLPIDFVAYRELKNHIAKALVPLLQIWLYASRQDGLYAKRYDELCHLLNLSQYRQRSRILEQFSPSLDELKRHGYLANWSIEDAAERKAYKIVFYHGAKFYRDRQLRVVRSDRQLRAQEREERPQPPEGTLPPERPTDDTSTDLVRALVSRGVAEAQARKVIAKVAPGQQVLDQVEWGDQLVRQGKVQNPPGLYVSLIRDNTPIPESFETSRKREYREAERHRQEAAREKQSRLEQGYRAYQQRAVDEHLERLEPPKLEEMLESTSRALLVEFKNLGHLAPDQLQKLARARLCSDVAKNLPLLGFTAFCESQDELNAPPKGGR